MSFFFSHYVVLTFSFKLYSHEMNDEDLKIFLFFKGNLLKTRQKIEENS